MSYSNLSTARCDQLLERAGICPANLPLTLSREQLHHLLRLTFEVAKDHGVMQAHYKQPPGGSK